ncbi:MAG: hypothetical protein P4L50_19270 [Anaerolineaceae bacterium]|nr:hypothetical protein [Anaerolineaceae bacterium]
MVNEILIAGIAIAFTILSGFGDAQGFIHAAKIWNAKEIIWQEMLRSGLGYGFGVLVYWISLRFWGMLGIDSPEIQTFGWFVVTIVGVALINGEISKWSLIDRVAAIIAILCVGLIMIRKGV